MTWTDEFTRAWKEPIPPALEKKKVFHNIFEQNYRIISPVFFLDVKWWNDCQELPINLSEFKSFLKAKIT